MATPRCAGRSRVASAPSIRTRPLDTSSSPAIRRKRVDFPHPDGPTKTTNSPSRMSRLTHGITTAVAKLLVTCSSLMAPIATSPRPPSSFHRSESKTADQLTLGEPAENQYGRDRHRRRRRQLGPEQAFGTGIGSDERTQWRGAGSAEIQCPEGFVPCQDDVEQHGRGNTRHSHRRKNVDDFVQQARPVHAGGLQDVAWYLFEIGV